jgi:3-oxoacyl-(acyl-carrier-protein) synthase
MRRVVITGMGVVTPLGHDVDQVFERILAKQCAIEPITAFDTSQFKVKLAAEVKDLNMEDYFNTRELKFNDRFTQFARIASKLLSSTRNWIIISLIKVDSELSCPPESVESDLLKKRWKT